MKHLIKYKELLTIGRPLSKDIPTAKVEAFLTEAEQLHIKPILGDKLFSQLLRDKDEPFTDTRLETLLCGGSYTTKCEEYHSFMGLKYALSYFVYAQNLMSGDVESTRYGNMVKDGEYSTHISAKERSEAYNNALEVANAYLQECVAYARHSGLISATSNKRYAVGGVTIRRIG